MESVRQISRQKPAKADLSFAFLRYWINIPASKQVISADAPLPCLKCVSACVMITWFRRSLLNHHSEVTKFYFKYTRVPEFAIADVTLNTRDYCSVRLFPKNIHTKGHFEVEDEVNLR
jgi:hypothetical protein